MISKRYNEYHSTPILVIKHVDIIQEECFNVIETFSMYSWWGEKLQYSTFDLFSLYELLKPKKLKVDNPQEYVAKNNDTVQRQIADEVCSFLNPKGCWWFRSVSDRNKCTTRTDYVPLILDEANTIIGNFNKQLDYVPYRRAIEELPALEVSLSSIQKEMNEIEARRALLKERYGKNVDWKDYYSYYAPKEENELSRRYNSLFQERQPLSSKVTGFKQDKKYFEYKALISFYYNLTLQNELDLTKPLPRLFFMPEMNYDFYALDLALYMEDKRFIECAIRCGNTETNWPIEPIKLLSLVAQSTEDFHIFEVMLQKYPQEYKSMLEKGKKHFGNYHYDYLITRHYLLAVRQNRLDEVIKLFNTESCLHDLVYRLSFKDRKINPYTFDIETAEEDTVPSYISPEMKAYLDETIVKGFINRRIKESQSTGYWPMDHLIDARTGRKMYLNAQDDPDIYTGPLD